MILTVIIAAKDAPSQQLRCCLASLARLENAREIEILIVNSGLLPASSQAFDADFGDFRIIAMTPQGVYAAYNRGIVEARGQYLIFFGVDDIALPGMDSAIAHLRRADPDYDLYAASTYMQGTGMSQPARWDAAILFRNWCHQGLFYGRKYLSQHHFDVSYPIQADHKANIEILANRQLNVGRSGELVSYFATGGSSQTNYDTQFRRDLATIARDNFGWGYGLAVIIKQWLANVAKGTPEDRQPPVARHRETQA